MENPSRPNYTTNIQWRGTNLDQCPEESDAFWVCSVLFSQAPGYAKIFERPKFRMYSTNVLRDPQKVAAILGANNYRRNNARISVATFKTADNGDMRNILSVNAICIDINFRGSLDPKIRSMNVVDAYRLFCREYLETGTLPPPTYIEYSYNFRLIYILDAPYFIPKGEKRKQGVLSLFGRIKTVLTGKIDEKWNPDHDNTIAPYIRIPESIDIKWPSHHDTMWNIKIHPEYSEAVKIEKNLPYLGVLWGIKQLAADVLPDLPEWYDTWKESQKDGPNNLRPKKNYLQDALFQRIDDLCVLQHSGYGDVECWKTMLYLYRLTAMQCGLSNLQALAATQCFNSLFPIPLSDEQVNQKSTPTNINQKFKNETIRKKLGLQKDQFPDLFKPAETRQQRYHRIKAQQIESGTLITKKQKLEDIYSEIQHLFERGYKQTEIAEKLDIPISTMKRYYASMRERGMIT